mgnify:CR=1 FL=1
MCRSIKTLFNFAAAGDGRGDPRGVAAVRAKARAASRKPSKANEARVQRRRSTRSPPRARKLLEHARNQRAAPQPRRRGREGAGAVRRAIRHVSKLKLQDLDVARRLRRRAGAERRQPARHRRHEAARVGVSAQARGARCTAWKAARSTRARRWSRSRSPNIGATIMGRNMFGGHPGAWDANKPWNGWWGDNPPFHHPVFVLTHHAREPLVMQGGTTFNFVTARHRRRARAGAQGGRRQGHLARRRRERRASSISSPAWSTRWRSTSRRCCSAAASGYSSGVDDLHGMQLMRTVAARKRGASEICAAHRLMSLPSLQSRRNSASGIP